ncbi:MAG: ATP-binding protein [Planctomycetota bacterium]
MDTSVATDAADRTPAPGPGAQRNLLSSRVGRRLLALFVGCALAPLLAFGWMSLSQVSSQLNEEMERTLHRSAKAAGMELADRLLSLTDELEVARELCARGDHGIDEASEPLRERLQSQFRSLAVQRDGTVKVLLGGPMVPVRLSTAQREHLADDKWLNTVIADADYDEPLVVLARRLRDGDPGAPLFVAALQPGRLHDVESLRGSGTEVLVLTADYLVVTRTTALPDLSPLLTSIKREPAAATFEWQVCSEPHLARYWRVFLRPQLGLDWFVVQSTPRSKAAEALRQFQTTFVLTAVLALLVVAATSLMQIRALLEPIGRLVAITRRVEGGDFDARAKLEGKDEFGELGRSFDQMTEALVENIRRRELTEVDLIAARDKALEAVRAKAEFLTNVSHELRTPLTSILSSAEILRQFGDEDPATRDEFLGIVCDQSQRLRDLIEGVLQLSSDGDGDQRFEPIEVAGSLRAAVAALPPDLAPRVRLDVDADLPTVSGAPDRLRQLWLHLLDNAGKFSPPGSPITVRARRRQEVCVVEVSDRGPGIAAADHAAIFEPFHQVSRDILTDKTAGIGLGLTLARSIAERHGGRIHVHSEPGHGATFRVVLPGLTASVLRLPEAAGASAPADPVRT